MRGGEGRERKKSFQTILILFRVCLVYSFKQTMHQCPLTLSNSLPLSQEISVFAVSLATSPRNTSDMQRYKKCVKDLYCYWSFTRSLYSPFLFRVNCDLAFFELCCTMEKFETVCSLPAKTKTMRGMIISLCRADHKHVYLDLNVRLSQLLVIAMLTNKSIQIRNQNTCIT